MNHTDDEVRSARTRLLARSDELRDRLVRVRLDLGRQSNPLPADFDDAAIVIENDEILGAIEKSALCELGRIQQALDRIDAGTFALCESCGREISAARLSVVPHATRCAGCEAGHALG